MSRNNTFDLITQFWVRTAGLRVELASTPWLDAPTGEPDLIGEEYFERYAERHGLRTLPNDPCGGLVPSFDLFAGPGFDPDAIHPEVRRFYEQTADYDLSVQSRWSPFFKPFGHLLALIFSRRLSQLNVPLTRQDETIRMTSRIVQLANEGDGTTSIRGWVRNDPTTGATVYVGSYSVVSVPDSPIPCIRATFPLPNGNAIVIMRPSIEPDGSLVIRSEGEGPNDAGFYFTVHHGDGTASVRYLRTFRESIRVFVDGEAKLQAVHRFGIWGREYLRLGYRMVRDDRHSG